MPVNNNYPTPSKIIAVTHDFMRDLARILKNAMEGKTNNTGEFILMDMATSTTFPDIRCNLNSVVLITPQTANAAALTDVYTQAGDKEFTIHHPSDANTDLEFRYVIVG